MKTTKLKKITLAFLLMLMPVLVFLACSDDDDKNGDPAGPLSSITLRSDEQGVIETGDGAKLEIPMYAVPLTVSENIGTLVFSVSKDATTPPVVPAGYVNETDIYRFEPDGYVFAAPVKITIPLEIIDEGREYEIYRINETTGEAEVFPTVIDYENRTISTYTYHLSPWAGRSRERDTHASGAIRVTNNSSSHSLNVSVVSFTPAFPTSDTTTCWETSAYFPARGVSIGISNTGVVYLPQGEYTLCFWMAEHGTPTRLPGEPMRWYVDDVIIDRPSTYSSPTISQSFSYSNPTECREPGYCDCIPRPTPLDDDDDPPDTVSTDVILPLAVGNTWNYRETEYSEAGAPIYTYEETEMVCSSIDVRGTTVFFYSWDEYCEDGELLANLHDGLYIFGDVDYEEFEIYDEAHLFFKYPASVGEMYSLFDYLTIIVSSTSSVQTVPAGTFTCYEYTLTSLIGEFDGDIKFYFAPGVGIVRILEYQDESLVMETELLSYDISR